MNKVYVKNHNPKYNFEMDIRDFNNMPDTDIPKELFEFFNQSEFAKKHGLRQTSIADCLSGKCKTHKNV